MNQRHYVLYIEHSLRMDWGYMVHVFRVHVELYESKNISKLIRCSVYGTKFMKWTDPIDVLTYNW